MADKYEFNLKKFLSLYAVYAKMDLSWFLRDTKICLMAIFSDFIGNIAGFSGVFLLVLRFGGVGGETGMNQYEVMFMLGYVTIVSGIFQMFFGMNNVAYISRRIGRGQVDSMLIQPLPFPVQLLTEGFLPVSGNGPLLTGILITGIALWQLQLAISFVWFGLLLFSLLVTVVLLGSLSYLFSSLAFYAPVAAEEISSYVFEMVSVLNKYPLSGMPISIQVTMISIVPAGLTGWFPVCYLLGKSPFELPLFFTVLVAGVFMLAASFCFKKGLNHYAKIGSNRYKSMGFRN